MCVSLCMRMCVGMHGGYMSAQDKSKCVAYFMALSGCAYNKQSAMFQLQIIEAAKSPRSRTLRQWDSSAQVWYKLIKKNQGRPTHGWGMKNMWVRNLRYCVYARGASSVRVYLYECVCVHWNSQRALWFRFVFSFLCTPHSLLPRFLWPLNQSANKRK